ncbi:MAG TPA: SGNH/GDSL hydrolase family protein [Nitrospira sp.]|nr:SGNH/GDSL hydrolase family protein [Nitrospira sp.]
MTAKSSFTLLLLGLLIMPTLALAQVNFPKQHYYVGMGDSVSAGEGALPVTNGYVYRLYEQGVFAKKQEMDFANIGIRGGRSWDLRDHQVSQLLCAEPEQRPTVVSITVGANDFLRGDLDISTIAKRVVQGIDRLLNNDGTLSLTLATSPVLAPSTDQPCRAIQNVTILVSNYYSLPHPNPEIFQQFDSVLQGFDQALRFWLQHIVVPSGSSIAVVDLYTPSLGRQGLVTIQRRLGFEGPFDFDFHPTNLGHAFIADKFKKAWDSLR